MMDWDQITCKDCGALGPTTVEFARKSHWGEPYRGWARTWGDPVTADEPWVCTPCLRQLLDDALEAMRQHARRTHPQRRHLRAVD